MGMAALLSSLLLLATALPSPSQSTDLGLPLEKRHDRTIPASGFVSPSTNGGSMLTRVPNTYPAGLGEPLNVVISAASDIAVLQDSNAFYIWLESVNFGAECLGQHIGDHQSSDLGDGSGYVNETAVLRYNYGDPQFGTCQETVKGGNHARYWNQTGPSLFTGALFLATSLEQDLNAGHDIQRPSGYDDGRDELVGNATVSGGTQARGWKFNTTVEWVQGLLPNGTEGVNHGIPLDGRVAVLTVRATPPEGGAQTVGGTGSAGRGRGRMGEGGMALGVVGIMVGLVVIV